MRETSSPRQIETLPLATLTVLLLTHAVSRHMMHITQISPCNLPSHALSRARACAWVRTEIGPYGARARCKPRWRPITAWSVCLPRGRGMGRSRPRTATIRLCIDTNRAAGLGRRLSSEYQSEAGVCVKGRQI